MRAIAAIILILGLGGCTAAPAPTPPPPAAVRESITFEMASWGVPITHWQVNEDGTGEIWRIANQKGRSEYDLQKFCLRLDEDGVFAVVRATEPLREMVRAGIDCQKQMSDLPYGRIVWTYPEAELTYAFDFGCGAPAAKRANQLLGEANEAVEKRAKIEPRPFATDHIGGT